VTRGLLLFAHGARDARWAQPFEEVARRVGARAPAARLALAYLELMQPDLDAAAARLSGAGCTHVEVLPLFLGAGAHVREDLPRRIETLRAAHPRIDWRLHPPVGEIESVIDAMATAALDVLNNARA